MGKGDLAYRVLTGVGGELVDRFRAARRRDLEDAYERKAEQMTLPIAERIQPHPFRDRFIDEDYHLPGPTIGSRDLSVHYPRNPDPDAPLPRRDRARVLIERQDEIADAIAQRIRDVGQMDAKTRFFYHSDGPLYRAAIKAGLSHDEAIDWLTDFSARFAATSPRTVVDQNLLNTTSVMAKEAAGVPYRDILGPGSGGLNEKGYPMMTNPSGIHGMLLDDVISGRGVDPLTNTKPFMFGQNAVGNRSGVTVDTHAIRGILQTLNRIDPGSLPDQYILPKHLEAYRANPETLTPDMLDDRVAMQKVGPKGATYDAQTEYPVLADLLHATADRLEVSPAEAQSMAWFGFGEDTGLRSGQKTFADVMDERLNVTGQVMGIPTEEAARRVFAREIPLFQLAAALGGGAGMLAAAQPEDDDPTIGLVEFLRSRGY